MFDRIILVDVFNSRIRNAAVIFEKWRQPPACDIAAFIDRCGQNRAAEFAKPNGIIGAATEERDTQRSPGCYHAIRFLLFIWIMSRRKIQAIRTSTARNSVLYRRTNRIYIVAGVVENESMATPSRSNIRRIA